MKEKTRKSFSVGVSKSLPSRTTYTVDSKGRSVSFTEHVSSSEVTTITPVVDRSFWEKIPFGRILTMPLFVIFFFLFLFSGAFSYYSVHADDYAISVSISSWQDYLDYAEFVNCPTITLTNLIVNGDMSIDADGFIFYRGVGSIVNGRQRVSAQQFWSGEMGIIKSLNFNNNNYFYITFEMWKYSQNANMYSYFNPPLSFNVTITNVNYIKFSTIKYISMPNNIQWHLNGSTIYTGDYLEIDNFMMFDLGTTQTYSKTFIDNLIAYYGYFEGTKTFPDFNHPYFHTFGLDVMYENYLDHSSFDFDNFYHIPIRVDDDETGGYYNIGLKVVNGLDNVISSINFIVAILTPSDVLSEFDTFAEMPYDLSDFNGDGYVSDWEAFWSLFSNMNIYD